MSVKFMVKLSAVIHEILSPVRLYELSHYLHVWYLEI